MHSVDGYVGQTLDEKYRLERLLGQGGMGAVYLATHLGTGRSVAVKLIAPALMRRSIFVERFKREARAAGRLRHPNIVDVTDFGFARVGHERIAYLVMEYLDGCTLHDVLEEERTVPITFVVEILEQVCSAVHEAHRQGIVHRDLKPENIWLEPNRLGGYRVKVLDFGIAKVAEGQDSAGKEASIGGGECGTEEIQSGEWIVGTTNPGMDRLPEGGAPGPESATILESRPETTADGVGAVGVADITPPSGESAAGDLTQVNALVGTPRYMSPEQCRGEKLDARSDIYSLGVIAHQMLSGTTPFTGEATEVIRAHLEDEPPSLQELNRRVPSRVSAVVRSALAKDPAFRPQSALAFANAIRANATGLGALYRRAFAFYCEHFPKVVALSFLAHIPVLAGVLLVIGATVWESQINGLGALGAALLRMSIAVIYIVSTYVAASTIGGVTAILVTQLEVAPLKQVELRTAFDIVRRRWRPFVRTGVAVCVRIFLGFVLVIPGMILLARQLFWAPVVLMEGLEGKAARDRSRALASRSWPAIVAAVIFLVVMDRATQGLVGTLIGLDALPKDGLGAKVLSKLVPLASILTLPLVSMVPALLYLKMRELGGETLTEIMSTLETGGARTRWEERMRSRVTLNAPPTPSASGSSSGR
ncbi:MAG: serine/threonine protein kinase [Verrucomicrobiales bacterium]|nr:serine/threonine protein kinase [Verrucomicrobiales bacterium]